jgi:hypothetical protein
MSSFTLRGLLPVRAFRNDELDDLRWLLEEMGALPPGIPLPDLLSIVDAHLTISVHWAASEDVGNMDAIVRAELEKRRNVAIVDVRADCAVRAEDEAEDSDSAAMYPHLAHYMLEQFVDTLVFAAHLALPGVLRLGTIAWFRDDVSIGAQEPLTGDTDRVREYSGRTGWPQVRRLSFATVLGWILKNAFERRAGDTPVSRAYNAYTHLFTKAGERNSFEMVIALIGIEALYNSSHGDVADQVRRRAQLLLGTRDSFKGDLSRMYQIRSQMVHGALPLLPKRARWQVPDAVAPKFADADEYVSVAYAVLVVSLQVLVDNDWNTLRFVETVDGNAASVPESDREIAASSYQLFHRADLKRWEEEHTLTTLDKSETDDAQ